MSNTQNWVAMGYIKGAFGIKGWIKVQSDTEYTGRRSDAAAALSIRDGRRVGSLGASSEKRN